jgi:hypothetical protein
MVREAAGRVESLRSTGGARQPENMAELEAWRDTVAEGWEV